MVTMGRGPLRVEEGIDPVAVLLEGAAVDTLVVTAPANRGRSSQQKSNSITPSRMHNVGQSNGYAEGKQLSEVFKGLS